MKHLLSVTTISLLIAFAGCDQGTSGGPGAASPPEAPGVMGQAEDTFSLSIPAVEVLQGATAEMSIAINRGKNFRHDVSLIFSGLPAGVTVEPAVPHIGPGDTSVNARVIALKDAALGDFSVRVAGRPADGADAIAETTITVAEFDPELTAEDTTEAARKEWDEYIAAKEVELEAFTQEYHAYQQRAADAEGDVKASLQVKVAEAKVKLDAATLKLEELKASDPSGWQKFKEGVGNAFDDLKGIFE